MSEQIKLCRHCNWYEHRPSSSLMRHVCLQDIDLVTGDGLECVAHYERSGPGWPNVRCGAEGLLWEPIRGAEVFRP